MANTVYTESVVTLNSTQAEATLNALKASADELRKKMIEATKMGDTDSAAKFQRQLDNVNKSVQNIRKETKDYSTILEKLNGASLNELAKAYSNINRQLKNLVPGTKEFVEKSNQLRQVKARMDEINTSVRGMDKSLSGIKGMLPKIGLAGVFTAAGSAIRKFATDAIAQTQLIGDKWAHFTYSAQSAYKSFVADLSAGKGWKELIQNMTEAADLGDRVMTMLDELFELQNALTLKESEYNIEIERNKQLLRDVTMSDEERLVVANEVMRLERELADERRTIAAQEMEARKMELKQRTKLTDAELQEYVANYTANREKILAAQEYMAKLKEEEAAVALWQKQVIRHYSDAAQAELATHTAALQALRAQHTEEIEEWANVDAKYQMGNDELVNNYVQAVAKMNQAEASFYSSTTRSATMMASLRNEISKENLAASENAYKQEIAGVDAHIKELQLKAKEAYAAGTLSEQQYQTRLQSIQEQGLRSKIAISERYKKETVDYQTQLLDLTLAQQEEFRKLLEDSEKEFAAAVTEAISALDAEVETAMEGVNEDFEGWLDHFLELVEQADELRAAMDPKSTLAREMESEMASLDEMYASKLISEEEYQQAKQDLIRRYTQANLQIDLEAWQGGVESAMSYLDQAGNAISALQEMREAQLEAQMQAELAAAGDNAEERERIESKYEEKKLDMQKKYAVTDMVINIAKTVAAGALAVMQAFAQLGPVAGGVMAAIIGATTAAQVATIVAQKNAIMNTTAGSSGSSSSAQRIPTGYASGGYTSTSANDYEEVGVVHANEWVAPAAMVRANPIVFRRLEAARLRGGHVSGVNGFADGGATTAGTVQQASSSGQAIPTELIGRLTAVIEQINSRGIHAYVLLSELNSAQELSQTFKQATSKK